MRIMKIPVRNQLDIRQVRGFIHGSDKKVRCDHQREMTCRRATGKPITGSRRKKIEAPRPMLCGSRAAFRCPFALCASRSLEIQHVSRMLVLGNRAGWFVVERFHCQAMPSHVAAGKRRSVWKGRYGAPAAKQLNCHDRRNFSAAGQRALLVYQMRGERPGRTLRSSIDIQPIKSPGSPKLWAWRWRRRFWRPRSGRRSRVWCGDRLGL